MTQPPDRRRPRTALPGPRVAGPRHRAGAQEVPVRRGVDRLPYSGGRTDQAGIAGRLAAKEARLPAPRRRRTAGSLAGHRGPARPGGRPGSDCPAGRPSWPRSAGLGPIDVSISHDGGFAIAVAAATTFSITPSPPAPPSRWFTGLRRECRSSVGIDKVRDWILGRHPDRTELASDVDIIESRLVDSLAFVELVYTIEDAAGIEVDFDNIDIEDFQTLATIEKAFFA